MKKQNTYWRVNEKIQADKLRVLASDDKQIGVLSKKEALAKAEKAGLDLVEIAPRAKPPVAKIIDFGKFKYQEGKKKNSTKVKSSDIKEIRFSPFIGDADYQTRLGRIKGFLGEKHKIRAVVKFKGRQMGSKKFGYDLLGKLLGDLGDNVQVDMEPKFVGRHLIMVISPIGKGKTK